MRSPGWQQCIRAESKLARAHPGPLATLTQPSLLVVAPQLFSGVLPRSHSWVLEPAVTSGAARSPGCLLQSCLPGLRVGPARRQGSLSRGPLRPHRAPPASFLVPAWPHPSFLLPLCVRSAFAALTSGIALELFAGFPGAARAALGCRSCLLATPKGAFYQLG